MKVNHFEVTQELPITIEKAWKFFSTPYNLAKITPPEMGFEVTSKEQETTYAGMIITYIVRPIFGIPTTWVTEITHVNAPNYFVDEQRFGPYNMWHHQHHFTETPNGVLMTDILDYVLPFGILGQLVHKLFVRKKIESIFNHRRKVLDDIFANQNSKPL